MWRLRHASSYESMAARRARLSDREERTSSPIERGNTEAEYDHGNRARGSEQEVLHRVDDGNRDTGSS